MKSLFYFFPLYDIAPIEIIDITTRIAPNIVTSLPENSLPNSNPSHIPPITPIPNPFLSISLHSSKLIIP